MWEDGAPFTGHPSYPIVFSILLTLLILLRVTLLTLIEGAFCLRGVYTVWATGKYVNSKPS